MSWETHLRDQPSAPTVGEKDQVAISRFEVSRVHVPEAPPHNLRYVIKNHTIFGCNLLLKSHKVLDPRTA